MMRAFLFPGQGSQEVGMGAELFREDAAFRRWIGLAGEWAGADLARICLRGPERELARTEFLQPLLAAVSLAWSEKLAAGGIQPDIVLGHSLGEIAALSAAGVLTPEEAIKVAARRGRLMGAAAARAAGGLLAVLNPERARVLQALSQELRAGRVYLASDNAPGQLLLSGLADGLAEAAQLLAKAGLGPCRRLPVSGPWHSPLMRQAQEEFAAWLSGVAFRPPRAPLLMNVSASMESSPDRIRLLVARNLTEPVQWRASMERLRGLGPQFLFEVGPGRVLAGLARANGFGEKTRIIHVNNARGLALAALTCPTEPGLGPARFCGERSGWNVAPPDRAPGLNPSQRPGMISSSPQQPILGPTLGKRSAPAPGLGRRLTLRLAVEADREAIYRLRHEAFARELHQHSVNHAGRLTDALDAFNTYVAACSGERVIGCISVTPPGGPSYSMDKYVSRRTLPFPFDDTLYELRLLTVSPPHRRGSLALGLMYAGFRWAEAQGGRRVMATGRSEILAMYLKFGVRPVGITVHSGAVTYEVLYGTMPEIHAALLPIRPILDRLESELAWEIGVPFRAPA